MPRQGRTAIITYSAPFGEWLRERRRQLDLTQANLARHVGCSTIAIRKMEASQRTPSRQIAERLADCLGIPVDERAAFIEFARGLQQHVADTPLVAPPIAHRLHNLPVPLTRLLGREQDVGQIRRWLIDKDWRLVTLIGPPGIGKTRLSIQVATELHSYFVDGVYFVSLASVVDPHRVIDVIAQTLNITEVPHQPIFTRLVEVLCGKKLLLVLDNVEHLLPAVPQVAALLTACRLVKVLSTSRAALRVRGEQLFPVAPLSLTDPSCPLETQTIVQSPAITLFVERTQAVVPSFTLTRENAPTVAAICARLDGVPLAIELVAARARTLSLNTLLARLGQRLDLLTHGPCDLPPRHQTLRSALEWSYKLFTPTERFLFEQLGVFLRTYSLEAAEIICGEQNLQLDNLTVRPSLSPSIVDRLAALVDHSMLHQVESSDGEQRFMMLEIVREYALERLEARGTLPMLRERHARYYAGLAETASSELLGGRQEQWLARLAIEHDHFRAALSWAINTGCVELSVRLGAALWNFWYTRCYISEGRRWLKDVLRIYHLSGTNQGSWSSRQLMIQVFLGAGILARVQGDSAEACQLYQQGLDMAQQLGDQPVIATALYNLAVAMYDQGQIEEGVVYLEQCIQIQRALSDTAGLATSLNGLGNVLLIEDPVRAVALFEESLTLQRGLCNMRGVAFTLHSLGVAALQQDNYAAAQRYFHEGLEHFQQLDDTIGIADCFSGLAACAGGQGQAGQAAQFWTTAEDLREKIGVRLSLAEQAIYEQHLDSVRVVTM